MTMPEMALRWILANRSVSTIIPGMRREKNVRMNISTSDGVLLTNESCANWNPIVGIEPLQTGHNKALVIPPHALTRLPA